MQIRIDAEPIGPLKVLTELPDARLAILEGLNGIGKTLAVRLLELCTGGRPYPQGSLAWVSLRNGLGEFMVSVSGLRGGQEIRWRADSRDWEQTSDDGLTPVQFREITIDGSPATVDDVRGLLVVHRVGGDEGIVETLARQADDAAEIVRRWARHYADQSTGPLARLEAAAAESLRLLGTWSLESYRGLAAAAEESRLQILAAAEAANGAQHRRDDLARALELSHRLEEMRRQAPDLSERLLVVDHQIEAVEAEREELQHKIRALAGQVAAARPLISELSNARRTVKRNREDLSQQLNTAATVAAALGISADMAAAHELIEKLDQQVAELTVERTELDAAPTMRGLLQRLIDELATVESRGLGNQIAVDDPVTEVQLTVAQTRSGMAVRRAYLEGKPPPPQAQKVIERLDRTNDSLDRARRLRSALDAAERYRRLVARNEDRVNRVLAQINPDALDQMQKLEAQRRESDDYLLQLAAERAALRQQLGTFGDGTTQRALTIQLRQVLQSTGVGDFEIKETYSEAETALNRAQVALTQAQERNSEVRRELLQAEAEMRRASAALVGHQQLAWIRNTLVRPVLPADKAAPQQQLIAIDVARQRVGAVNDRLGDLRGQLGALESALREVSRHLRGGLDPQAVQYVPELQSWLGKHFSDWFNNARVRHELLRSAEGEVEVNVSTREVIWREKGNRRARPLEAFSSGEQAFAYTRARLAVLDEEEIKPLNRLIVLDEFGAFIAHDRLAGLLAYLQERVNEHTGDQVLVVLPLSQNYAEQAKSTYGIEAERFGKLAEEIDARGYAVRTLEE
jgi:hypothetical protein